MAMPIGFSPAPTGMVVHHFQFGGIDDAQRGVVLVGDEGARSIRQESDAARAAAYLESS